MANTARKSKAKRKRVKESSTPCKKLKISESTEKSISDDKIEDCKNSVNENNQDSVEANMTKLKDQLLEKVEEELKCNICTEFLIKPIALSCSHTFCEHCISQWKRQQFRCPICREKIYSESPVLALDLFIEKCLEMLSPEKNKDRKRIIASREKTKAKPRRSERLRSKRFVAPIDDLALNNRWDTFHFQDFHLEENYHLRDLIDEVLYLANQVEFATVQ